MNYTHITKEFTEEFFRLVQNSHNITITSHFSPDGDSISCVLSMYRIIYDRYPEKDLKIVYSGEIDERFSYFQNFGKIIWAEDMTDEVKDTDLLIVLDLSIHVRFTRYPEKLEHIKNQICIDHHASGSEDFTLSTIIPEMSSCSELIFRIFENSFTLDKNLAEIFLLGILSDTGSFSFVNSSQSETFSTAKKLLDVGDIQIDILKSKYSPMSAREFTLVQEFIKNTSFEEVQDWPPVQYSYISREFVQNGNYSDNEISAGSSLYVSMYIRSIKNYTWGFVLKPKNQYCAISARSLSGSVNVRDLFEKMSLGGGHDRASGGIFKRDGDSNDPQICIKQIVEWMKNNKPLMN